MQNPVTIEEKSAVGIQERGNTDAPLFCCIALPSDFRILNSVYWFEILCL